MAKKISWTDQAKADVRAIDRQPAMRILHGLARFTQTEEGEVKRLQDIEPPEFRLRVGAYRIRFYDHGYGRWSRREVRRRTVGICRRTWVCPLNVQRLGFLSTSHGVGRWRARTCRNDAGAAAAVPGRRAVAPALASSRGHHHCADAEPGRVPRQLGLTSELRSDAQGRALCLEFLHFQPASAP